MLIMPPDFRTRLPARVDESGRIFRDIEGLGEVFDTKGSGSSPELLRAEMGVLYGFDLEAVMATQLAELDVVPVAASPAGANTTVTTAFSFPTLPSGGPAARHKILAASITFSVADVANFDAARLDATVFGDPSTMVIGWTLAADVVNAGGLGSFAPIVGLDVPLWGRRESEYIYNARSNAGGGTTTNLELLVLMVPAGVEVP